MVKFMNSKRTDQNMDTYIMEFEMLRERAESRMLMRSGFPAACVSALCVQNAALPKNEKTTELATLGNTSAFPQVPAQMQRLFGPCGDASRHDVLVAQDMDTASEKEDFEAWLAYRKAKRATRGSGEPKKESKNGGRRLWEP